MQMGLLTALMMNVSIVNSMTVATILKQIQFVVKRQDCVQLTLVMTLGTLTGPTKLRDIARLQYVLLLTGVRVAERRCHANKTI